MGPLRVSSLLLVLIGLSLSFGQMAAAEEPPKAIFDPQAFSFEAKNRRDPFEPTPLLRARQIRETGRPKGRPGELLKQGYEMEELRLVGIIDRDRTKYAMMEDLQGKGVLFKKGDPVNQQVWVIDIVENKVVFGYRAKGSVRKFDMEIEKR